MIRSWFDHHACRLTAVVMLGLNFLVWLPGTHLSLHAAPNAQVGVRAYIVNPPNAVTDLQAAPVGSQNGDIQLSWTAPANANTAAIAGYTIKFATYPAATPAQGETWWTQAGSQTTLGSAFSPGVQEFTTLSGFTVGVTYYFGIKSTDVDGMMSPVDERVGEVNQARSLPLSAAGPPETPDNFAGVAQGTSTIEWTWNPTLNATFFTINVYPSGTLIDQTNDLSLTESNLTPNLAVSRTLRSGNGFGLSDATAPQTVYTWAAVAQNPALSNVTYGSVSINWSANGNPPNTQYRVERSLDGSAFTVLTLVSTTSLTDSSVSPETFYAYRIRAMNGDGVLTVPSVSVSTVTPPQIDFMPPQVPMGLKGFLDSTGLAFTLIWDEVLTNADGTSITDLLGYNIYRSSSLIGPGVRLNPNPIAITAFADSVNNNVYFYRVRAIDTHGNESGDSLIADSTPDENVIFLATDNVTSVIMPSSVNSVLRSAHNKYGVSLTVSAQEEPVPPNSSVVRSVRLNYLRGDTLQAVSDLSFSHPQSLIAIGYNLSNGILMPGAPHTAAAHSSALANATPNQLSIFWNNGVTWVNVGGKVNPDRQAVEIKSSYLGQYQLRIAAQAGGLHLAQNNVFPRIFTPNGDGFNDQVYFVLENPNDAHVRGEIFDMYGRKVATLPGPSATGIGTTLIWDGKDSSGSVVPGGAYIYKIQGEGRTFTGTVAVAR